MHQVLKAVYRAGAFIPLAPCDLPENISVELIVRGVNARPPEITNIEDRASLLKRIVERMMQNPLPIGASLLTREALHERY